MTSQLHVATTGDDGNDGSAQRPYRTINRAAAQAMPGDTVVVHEGTYREWVTPRRGGLSDTRRITYRAADGEHVVITGAEQITTWQPENGTVWRAELPDTLFGDFNPYREKVEGDWVVDTGVVRHLGEVYLDGRSLYEAATRAELDDPAPRTEVRDHWTDRSVPIDDPAATTLLWYAEAGPDTTTIWANFQGADPNTANTEINVRRSVFSPLEHHLDWITVRGFELCRAACPWTPPTADQPGLIGPNWAKGWIIEDNDIHHAKCSAVSLGKEASTGDNYASTRGDKPGYQYQLEAVFSARQIGWDREHIGSHVVRRNHIHDCGQNGIVGHLGGVFSTIEDNRITRIATRHEFYGYEIAGIKMHAAIDVTIRHNHIHDCTLGIWLDWQTQGTRLTRNVLHDNQRDLFVEVSHGPYLVDHNVLASPATLELFSQGGAFAGNLILGTVRVEPVLDRPTPYHRPHSTQVAGYAPVVGGDDRWIGNLFIGGDPATAYGPQREGVADPFTGTAGYDGHPASFEQYLARVGARQGDHQRFTALTQPVYATGNVYAAGPRPFTGETEPVLLPDGSARVVRDGDHVYLETTLPPSFTAALPRITGADLPRVRFADADFEEPDGTPARLDTDLLGATRSAANPGAAGPVASLTAGTSRTRIW